MMNSSTLTSSANNGAKSRYRKVTIGSVILVFAVGISLGLYFIFANEVGATEVDTKKTQQQIRSGEAVLKLGDYEICNWEIVEFDSHIPLMIDGKDEGFFDFEEDILVQGFLCSTNQEVLLAVDDQGLHGSILDSDNVVKITAIDEVSSILTISDKELPTFTQSEKTKAVAEKWNEYIASQQSDRRAMNVLEPGSVDIHIHLDIDSHMVETHGTAFAAARYGVELIAVVNRDAYIDLGFNLKVVSINVRSSYLSPTQTTDAYLTELEKIPRPFNVNLLHSLTTRGVGGGIAYLGGLYNSYSCYGVSEVYGDFHSWDRYVVAHELGHNFGADHTHEMSPQVDTCGTSCPANPSGTIMSYCHLCNGGLSNLRYEWHERVRDVILNDYASQNGNLASRYACQSFPQYPDVGVPFSLQGDACLTIDTTACTECSTEICTIDSVYQFTGTQVKASQDPNFCWTTSDSCDSISLQTCGDSINQQFSFEDNSLKSESCGQVKHEGGAAKFEGSLVLTWCSPDENPNAGPSCDQTIIPLGCGDTHTGSTVDDCDGQRLFTFVAPDGPVSVSTCGSSFDTVLSVQNEDSRVYYSDDEGNCNTRAELLNMDLDQGEEYTIVLDGFGTGTGDYNIAITCPDDDSDPATSSAPTDDSDPCDSTIIELECGVVQTGSTVNSCNGVQSFMFTASTSMKTISACGSQYDTIMSIYDSNNNLITSNDDSGNNGCGYQSLLENVPLMIGAEYIVVLSGWDGQVGTYNMELTCEEPTPCDSIINIACGDVLTGSTADSCDGQQRFAFTATTSMKTISTCGSQYDTMLTIYSANGVEIFHQDDSDECNRQSFIEDLALDIGTEYTILLEGFSNRVGEYIVELMCQSDDESSTPTLEPTLTPTDALTPTLEPTSEPTFGCDSAIIAMACGDVLSGNTVGTCDSEQRFVFTATTNVKTISACGSDYDTLLTIYDSNNQEIARQVDSDSTQVCVSDSDTCLQNGAGWGSQYTCANSASWCNSWSKDMHRCCPDTCGTGSLSESECNALSGQGSCVYPNAAQSCSTPEECDSQLSLEDIPLIIGTEYTVVLSGRGSQEGNYNMELICDVPEEPCDSTVIDISCGETLTGSTVGSCDGEQRFAFTATTDLKTVSSCGSQYDTMLTIYSANGEEVYHQDDSDECNRQSFIQDLAVEVGSEYTIVLHGYSNRVGDYSLQLTCGESPSCDDSIQTLTCGDVLTQSTVNACEGVQTFQFTATSGLTTISSCNSEFDTMLEVVSDNGFNRFVDDSDECGYHSVISDMALQEGDNYFVTLSGYSGLRGNYQLEMTCVESSQTTYTTIRGGKCQTLDGGEPSFEYFSNEPNCEQLCTGRADCHGYSLSRHSHCLLWTQSDIMGGGARWGHADCHIKDSGVLVNFEGEPEQSG